MDSVRTTGRALLASVAVLLMVACGSSTSTGGSDIGSGALTGAGSSFDNPLFSKAFFDYTQQHPNVTVNYQPIGSGGGIKAFIARTVDFGATDVPMGSADIASAGGASALTQIPVTLGVVAVAFNVKGVTSLSLDPDTLAGIYLGTIKTWNDPKIAALNSGVTLPSTKITSVHRADSSGTTYIFTDYLSKVSSDFKSAVGTSKAPPWPTGVGIGAQQTQGVAQAITSTDGAVGYVELAYAVQTNMHSASLKNANGKFVQPTVAGATAAASQNTSISATNFSIVNEPGDDTYPIAGFSWVILRTDYSDANKGKALAFLFKWLVSDGQSEGSVLQYAPLPSSVQQLAMTNLKLVKAGGSAVLS